MKEIDYIYYAMRRKCHRRLCDLSEVQKAFPQYSKQMLSAYLFELTKEGKIDTFTMDGKRIYDFS